ncbi:hypothetical protein [Haloarchaeobius sp. DFWS5]|uniref:hypothetical protein n=1 Tax=Haloarchaeobius sp. DFWS5 TaxID=3446114 RepID=UPI003EBCB714
MPIPGYDLDDIEEHLRQRIDDKELRELLTEEEWKRHEEGEDLVDLLDEEDIERLLVSGDDGEN